ncbi:MAG: hypothetical protein V7L01_28910 [Nostoc sp.]|uniref:hypothetical protein n=1 Tax=Nostoc sp. TaxID=1180 RepID=UPI002FF91FE4
MLRRLRPPMESPGREQVAEDRKLMHCAITTAVATEVWRDRQRKRRDPIEKRRQLV